MPKLMRIDDSTQPEDTSVNVEVPMPEEDTGEFAWLTVLPDRSRAVTLHDGTICIFRPPKIKDLREMREANIVDELQSTIRLVARVCTKWGDKPGITPIQLDDLETADFMRISTALEPFLQPPKASMKRIS